MRVLITIFFLLISLTGLGQTGTSSHLVQRISFTGGGLYGVGVEFGPLSSGIASRNKSAGFAATAEYSLTLPVGLTGGIGIGLQALPAGVEYSFPSDSFNVSEESFDFNNRITEYGGIVPFIPVKLGWSFREINKLKPSFSAGLNFYIQNSFSAAQTHTYIDTQNGSIPIARR